MAKNFPHGAGAFRLRPVAAGIALMLSIEGIPADATMAGTGVPLPAYAASPLATTIVVHNCDDSGSGSLRAAMTTAVDGDTIDLTQLGCSLITLTTGAVRTNAANLHMIGPGAGALDISGDQHSSVLYHIGAGTIGIFGITFADGSYTGSSVPTGGCLYSTGSIALYNSIVRDCALAVTSSTTARGGGIYAKGNLTLADSTVSGNICENFSGKAIGGGIFAKGAIAIAYSTIDDNIAHTTSSNSTSYGGGIANAGNALVAGSTISGNSADFAAGAGLGGFTATQTMIVEESTISGNHAGISVGGLNTGQQPMRILNSTIAFNTEDTASGAGLYVYGSAELQGTIIAGNVAGSSAMDVGGSPIGTLSGQNNLIMHSMISVPSGTIAMDPQLAPLADNGGRTRTHAPAAGSPAINHGNDSAGFGFDQRGTGFARIVGASADIGAFESNGDIIFANGFN